MTITTRTGKSVESPYTDAQAKAKLKELIAQGHVSSDFAHKLARLDRHSFEQRKWIHVLVVEGEARKNNPSHAIKVGPSLARLKELFQLARTNGLRTPKIRLSVTHGPRSEQFYFKIYEAGETSKFTGQIQIVENDPAKVGQDGVFGTERNRWIGRIDEEGIFHGSGKFIDAEPNITESIIDLLEAIVENPAEVAGTQGRFMGRCVFCAIALTDGRSIAVGYGPTCAKNYGLPWGPAKKEKLHRIQKEGTEFEDPDPELDPLFEDQERARLRFDAACETAAFPEKAAEARAEFDEEALAQQAQDETDYLKAAGWEYNATEGVWEKDGEPYPDDSWDDFAHQAMEREAAAAHYDDGIGLEDDEPRR